jgi:hypothetical protein
MLGWLAAAGSVLEGIRNVFRHGQDFEWGGMWLLVHHVNPWQDYLTGFHAGTAIGASPPNYLHFFYLMLTPFRFLSFRAACTVWAVCNLFFTAVSLWLIKRIFQQSTVEWRITTIAFLCGTPFRNDVGNGQHALLVLVLVALAYGTSGSRPNHIYCGLSYFKYSFAPPFFFDLLFSRGVVLSLVSLLPTAIGIIGAHLLVGGPWWSLIVGPVQVSKVAVRHGYGDLMTVVDTVFPWPHEHSLLYLFLEYGIPCLAVVALAWYLHRRSGLQSLALLQTAVATCSTAALMLFRHLPYDYLVLVFAFALAVKYRQQWYARTILIIISYFWFLMRLGDFLGKHTDFVLLNCALLGLILYCLLRIRHRETTAPVPGMRIGNRSAVMFRNQIHG